MNEAVANLREAVGESGTVEGYVAPGFEPVAEAFLANFRQRGEVGASTCVVVGGETRVDLWGGYADRASGRAWERDTISVVFSATKGATALCAHVLASRGALDIEAPVVELWPEFGRHGKEAVTARMMLDHSAGVPALRAPVAPDGPFEWDYMTARIADEEPFWQPGIRNGYHGLTIGWNVGELVRRISGRSLGTFFQEEIARPLGLDFWIGLPEALEARVAPMIPYVYTAAQSKTPFMQALRDRGSIASLFYFNSGKWRTGANTRAAHAAEIPAANGIGNGRSLAGLYAPLANGGSLGGVSLVDATTLARMGEVSMATHDDATLRVPTRFALGYMKAMDNRRRGRAPEAFGDASVDSLLIGRAAFGHVGHGGSLGFADPDCGLALGYTMNRMGPGLLMNGRGQGLVDAAYRCLGYRNADAGVWMR